MSTPEIAAAAAAQTPATFTSRRTLVLRRFVRNRAAMASLVILVLLFVGCYALPPLLPWSYTDLDFYALQDPRDGAVFYIGKGIGDRVHAHVREALGTGEAAKLGRIREIQASGAELRHVIIRSG